MALRHHQYLFWEDLNMYSWEIDKIIKEHNYNLPSSIYINICNTSPQLIYIGVYGNNIKIVAKEDYGDHIEYPEWIVKVYPG